MAAGRHGFGKRGRDPVRVRAEPRQAPVATRPAKGPLHPFEYED